MKKYLIILTIIFLGANILAISCKGKNQDEDDIKDILQSSVYTDEDQSRAFEDNDTTPETSLMLAMPDTMTIPWVRFVRRINSFTRHISVEIKDTIATATIGTSATGYFVVINDQQNPVRYFRPINDTGIRTVYLTKSSDRWHIRKISPKDIWTKNGNPQITILNIKAIAIPSGDTFEISNPDTLLTKEQLPTFYPNDTVKVTVTIQVPNDSAWVFLHRGRVRPYRKREPFFRTGTYTFERTWIISADADVSYTAPEARSAAIDAIHWQTLWGDSLAVYNCRAWALPYIVKRQNESYPDSE
jgi:hypothetical protein